MFYSNQENLTSVDRLLCVLPQLQSPEPQIIGEFIKIDNNYIVQKATSISYSPIVNPCPGFTSFQLYFATFDSFRTSTMKCGDDYCLPNCEINNYIECTQTQTLDYGSNPLHAVFLII